MLQCQATWAGQITCGKRAAQPGAGDDAHQAGLPTPFLSSTRRAPNSRPNDPHTMTSLLRPLDQLRVIIPTYNAEPYFDRLAPALLAQGIRPSQLLIVDSSSRDATAARFTEIGARVLVIPQSDFNHGGTRRIAAELEDAAVWLIYLTQDAIPAHPEAFSRLLESFEDDRVGMAYGRQLPRTQARALERHARELNYPPAGIEVRTIADKARLGIKATFCSDSFAAYRRSALIAVGNFPQDAFFGEDQVTAGRMLQQGWRLAYVGDACVEHSHDYGLLQEFQRYFDVGVFHARADWLLQTFGKAEGEGLRFVISEIRYLLRHEPASIPRALAGTLAKYAGYRAGRLERFLSPAIKANLSMAPAYWKARLG